MIKISFLNIKLRLFSLHKNQILWNHYVDELLQFIFYVRPNKQGIYNLKNERSKQIEFIFYNNKILK